MKAVDGSIQASPRAEKHRDLVVTLAWLEGLPDPDVRLRRHVSLAKFARMVDGQQLHFARLCDLGDRFEGRLPLSWVDGTDSEAVERVRRVVRVNCWHAEDVESDA